MHVHVCVHVCMCMCTCVGATPNHPHPHYPPTQIAPPSSTYGPPTPRAAGSWKHQNWITLELIRIIRFCLKILYFWTFLNSYRLDLMCRWGGVSYSKLHFYVFDAKKCSCDPPIKNFPVFVLDPTRPCLDWQLRAILTSQPIYDPFKCEFEWRPKCKIGLNVNLPKNHQAEKNFKCTLRCSNVSSTNHQLTLNPYHWPFMV